MRFTDDFEKREFIAREALKELKNYIQTTLSMNYILLVVNMMNMMLTTI